MSSQLRVLVVDDSAFNRRTITRILEAMPGVAVADYAMDGEEALRKVFDVKPDLITLDLEMPRMDGFTFLRLVMQNRPTPIIVVSARSEDENVFKALEFGALDFVAKPAGRVSPELSNIRDDLVRKVEAVARVDLEKLRRRTPQPSTPAKQAAEVVAPAAAPLVRKDFTPVEGPHLIAIGSSTGGPPALQTILTALDRHLPAAVVISQHMPPGFTRAFAERLNRYCDLEIVEAQTGDIVAPGRVLIAPGGRNLTLRRHGSQIVAHVLDPEPGQRYVPSVDMLFSTASRLFGEDMLAVVLTGMGNDGTAGVQDVKRRGGQVIAESEETSVVFGMPKEAIATGAVDEVLPLYQVAASLMRRCSQ